MAKQFSYQLREDLSVSEIISFVTKLKDNHLLIDKSFLKLGEYPTISQLNFEVTYDKEKFNQEGYVEPRKLIEIFSSLKVQIINYVRENTKDLPFVLPTENDGDAYYAFYLSGEYDLPNSLTSQSQQNIAKAFYGVVTGNISQKEDEVESIEKPDEISQFSYDMRAGDLIDAWTKNGGTREFAELLLNHPAKDLKDDRLVPASGFGPQSTNKNFAFEQCLGVLDDYYEKFKEYVKHHKNYNHPEKSPEKKALDQIESKKGLFFDNRRFETLSGKKPADNQKINKYIEIIKAAIEALKKDVPPPPPPRGGDDVDGGEASEEEQKDPFKKAREENKIIDFDQLYLIVKDQLVIYIFENYYQEFIDKLADKYAIRKALLKIISDKVDANFNLKVRLRSKLNTTWSELIKDDEIINDEALISYIEDFIVELANTLEIAGDETEDIKKVISPEVFKDIESAISGKENFESTEGKTTVKGVSSNTSAAVVSTLIDKGKVDENFSEESWEKLTLSQKVDFWKQLSLSERAEFINDLVKKGFIDDPNIYAQRIAEDIIDDQLAQRNIKKTENLDLGNIQTEMQAALAAELLNIPPSEFINDPELFIQNQRKNTDFLRFEHSLQTKYVSLLDLELNDYALHFPEQVIVKHPVREIDFAGIASIEDAAKLVNPNLSSNEEISQRFENASVEVFRLIDVNFGHDFGLPTDDIGQSLNDIRPYLQEFLLSEFGQEGLYILYNETQLNLFISKYGDEFIDQYGRYFMPLIEERYNEAHRQQVLVEMAQLSGGGSLYATQVDDAFHFILTEAVQSQIDPEKYIDSLSDEKLLGLFNPPVGFDQAQTDKFRGLVKEYLEVLRDIYNLDELIDDSGEFDEEDFEDGTKFYQQQARRNGSPINSGRRTFEVATATGLSPDEMAEIEGAEYQERVRAAILEAYSKENINLLKEREGYQQMAVYEWEKMLRDQQTAGGQGPNQKKKAESKTRKAFKKGIDKAIVGGSTAALGLIPGVGTAAAGVINILPIPDKYKKYVAIGALGTAIGFIAYNAKIFLSGPASMFFGSLGAIGGAFFGGPAGAFGGWLGGTWLGHGIDNFFGTTWSNIGNIFNNVAGAIGDGLSGLGNLFGSNNASRLSRVIPRGVEIGTGAGSTSAIGATRSMFGTTAGQSLAATLGTGIVGGVMITSNIHNAFLMRPPEFITINEDPAYKYVQVEKRASKSTMENGEVSDITYSVTISPQDGYIITVNQALDNMIILGTDSGQYSFQADQAQITTQLQPSTEISSPVTIQYTIPNVSGTDIALNNTFSLDFSVEEEGVIVDYKVQDSASVIIGDPQLGCFIFGESGVSIRGAFGSTNTSTDWTDTEKQHITNAFQKVANSAQFISLACNGGPITLYRYRNSAGLSGGYSISPNGDAIGFYDFLKYNNIQPIVDYTLIHELGHSIYKKNPGIQNSFMQIWSGSCFTYDVDKNVGKGAICPVREAFPEAIALYTIHSYYNFTGGRYDFPNINPTEYAWIENNIYGGGN